MLREKQQPSDIKAQITWWLNAISKFGISVHLPLVGPDPHRRGAINERTVSFQFQFFHVKNQALGILNCKGHPSFWNIFPGGIVPVNWKGQTKGEEETISFPLVDRKSLVELGRERHWMPWREALVWLSVWLLMLKGTCNPSCPQRTGRLLGYLGSIKAETESTNKSKLSNISYC
jgi:hypothetical protein